MSKVKPTRATLAWNEIHEIERAYAGNQDVKRLIRHIRFIEHLLAQNGQSARVLESEWAKVIGNAVK